MGKLSGITRLAGKVWPFVELAIGVATIGAVGGVLLVGLDSIMVAFLGAALWGQMVLGNSAVRVVTRAVRECTVDTKEGTRRVLRVFRAQAMVLGLVIILSVGTKQWWIALVAGIWLLVWLLIVLKVGQSHRAEPPGRFMERERYS